MICFNYKTTLSKDVVASNHDNFFFYFPFLFFFCVNFIYTHTHTHRENNKNLRSHVLVLCNYF